MLMLMTPVVFSLYCPLTMCAHTLEQRDNMSQSSHVTYRHMLHCANHATLTSSYKQWNETFGKKSKGSMGGFTTNMIFTLPIHNRRAGARLLGPARAQAVQLVHIILTSRINETRIQNRF